MFYIDNANTNNEKLLSPEWIWNGATVANESVLENIVHFADACIEATLNTDLDTTVAQRYPYMIIAEKMILRGQMIYVWLRKKKNTIVIDASLLVQESYHTLGVRRFSSERDELADYLRSLVNTVDRLSLGQYWCPAMVQYFSDIAISLYQGPTNMLWMDLLNRLSRLAGKRLTIPASYLQTFRSKVGEKVSDTHSPFNDRRDDIDEQRHLNYILDHLFEYTDEVIKKTLENGRKGEALKKQMANVIQRKGQDDAGAGQTQAHSQEDKKAQLQKEDTNKASEQSEDSDVLVRTPAEMARNMLNSRRRKKNTDGETDDPATKKEKEVHVEQKDGFISFTQ